MGGGEWSGKRYVNVVGCVWCLFLLVWGYMEVMVMDDVGLGREGEEVRWRGVGEETEGSGTSSVF